MELIKLLEMVSVLNQDDGRYFKNPGRLNIISSLLWDSEYRRINADGLFHLYAKHPAEFFFNRKTTIVSSHVDCEKSITRCFSQSDGNDILKGTYDNAITNTAILSLMLSDSLPDDILVAFTGDEERSFKGAQQLERFLRINNIAIRHLFVLDVTDMGWINNPDNSADFTIENDFWYDDFGKNIIELTEKKPYKWKFVPADLNNIPSFVPEYSVIHEEAAEDESWYYNEKKINCCSICLPVFGEMHSNKGVLVWESSFRKYTDMLVELLRSEGQ